MSGITTVLLLKAQQMGTIKYFADIFLKINACYTDQQSARLWDTIFSRKKFPPGYIVLHHINLALTALLRKQL